MNPVLPLSGYAGWRYLSQNLDTQIARFTAAPTRAADITYFRETIAQVGSAAELVGDFRLLQVSLAAFGLQEDLPNRAFIHKVLADGVQSDDALSNRLADKRYRAFSAAFGFGAETPPNTASVGFADRILARFQRQAFEVAVGDQNPDLRLALTAQRELPELAARGLSETTNWLTVLGNPPLRAVFETALSLPESLATLDLDRQVETFRAAAERRLGSSEIAAFAAPARTEDLLRAFMLQSQLQAGPSQTTPGFAALTLLQQIPLA